MIRPMRSADYDDVERIIGDFGAAASRAQRGGLDGCEISVLGHLGGQFRSPAVNRRTDGYGGRHDEDFPSRIAQSRRSVKGGDACGDVLTTH